MISIFRYGLSIFLVCLQLIAPLIHAHKNENFTHTFHLPEFEQIDWQFEKNSTFFAPITQNDQIVTVSAGMKNNKRRILSVDDFKTLLILPLILFSLSQCRKIVFFSKAKPINFFRFLNLNAPPRAPPFFCFY